MRYKNLMTDWDNIVVGDIIEIQFPKDEEFLDEDFPYNETHRIIKFVGTFVLVDKLDKIVHMKVTAITPI